MKIDRRTFAKSLGGAAAMLALPSWATKAGARGGMGHAVGIQSAGRTAGH